MGLIAIAAFPGDRKESDCIIQNIRTLGLLIGVKGKHLLTVPVSGVSSCFIYFCFGWVPSGFVVTNSAFPLKIVLELESFFPFAELKYLILMVVSLP